MPQRSQEEHEGNPKDQQTNPCIDQGHIMCALNGKATEQRPERGCRPGQDSDNGDDTMSAPRAIVPKGQRLWNRPATKEKTTVPRLAPA
jgi:hypothetical protein